MEVLTGVEALQDLQGPSAVTIGTFDGVHLGHRDLIATTIDRAARHEARSVVITWDRHPSETLRPDRVPPLLTTTERKLELLQGTGVEATVVLPFDDELSRWPPERFVQDILVAGVDARAVLIGANWRFGHKAAGDVSLLSELGAGFGFEVEGLELAQADGGPVSSSRVRKALVAGELDSATSLLTRPHDVDGVVEHGDDRGASLGFPTANVATDPKLAHPPRGVYAGRVHVRGETYGAAINLGVNPTFGGDPEATRPRIEAYLLDFEGDIYGETIRVEWHARLRDELRFDSVDALIDQMGKDVEETRGMLT